MTTLLVVALLIALTASVYYGLQDRSEQRRVRRRRELKRRQRQDFSGPRRTDEGASEEAEDVDDDRPGRDAILGWSKGGDGDRRS